MDKGIGARLAARARELQLTNAEVARRAGLAESRYAHYVAGSREPDFDTFMRICRVLDTTPDRVLGFMAHAAQGLDALLDRRVVLALVAMDRSHKQLAADLLDLIATRSPTGVPGRDR